MKILVIDPLSPFGHKDINKVFLDSISKEFEVIYIASSSFTDIVPSHISFIPIESSLFTLGVNSFQNRWRISKVIITISKHLRRLTPDVVFYMSYETITFSILYRLFLNKFGPETKTFLMNHLNIDELSESFLKRLFFLFIPLSCVHVVYEDFIRDYVRRHFGRNTLTFHHNLNSYKRRYICNSFPYQNFFEGEHMTYIVAPSGNSFNEVILNEIMALDDDGYLSNHNIRVFIKNRKIRYQSDHLIITNAYLSDDEYSYVLDKSSYILLPYDLKYRYRASGVYFDALTFSKPIIFSGTLFFDNQEERFGELGLKIRHSIRETFDMLNSAALSIHERNIKIARQFYDDQNFQVNLNKLLVK